MILNTVKMFHNKYPFESQSHGIDFSSEINMDINFIISTN
jgi:hypothetical protein